MAKDKICCARLKGRIVSERAYVFKLAQRAAARAAKGLIVTEELKLEIANAKAAVATAEETLSNHEADHAGEAQVA